MLRVFLLSLLILGRPASAIEDGVPATALAGDDICEAGGGRPCALNALQRRIEVSADAAVGFVKECPTCGGGKCHCAWADDKKCGKTPANPTCCRKCCCDEFPPGEPSGPTPPDDMASFTCEEQVDYPGGDKSEISGVASLEDCASHCKADKSCNLFVFNSEGYCWLKDGTGLTSSGWWAGKLMGVQRTSCKDSMESFTCEEQVNYPGGDISEVSGVESLKECAVHCKANGGCTLFVYNADGYCWLKDGTDLTKKTWWPGKLAGVKRTSCIAK